MDYPQYDAKKGRIEIMARDGGSIGFKMELANAYATSATYIYNSDSSEPMNYTITVTAGILRINGDNDTIHKQTWDDGTAFDTPTPLTVIEEDVEPKILNSYLEDKQGNRVAKPKINQELYLIVKTKDMINESIDIDLSDSNIDFEYQGSILADDQLNNYNVTNDLMKIPLIARKQQ